MSVSKILHLVALICALMSLIFTPTFPLLAVAVLLLAIAGVI